MSDVRIIGLAELPLSAARDDVRIGLPNGGALHSAALSLVRAGFGVDVSGRRLVHELRPGVTAAIARSNDLPHLLAAGVVDVAVTAHDYAVDSGAPIVAVTDFGLVPGRIVALALADHDWRGASPVRIVTQYPGIAAAWAAREGLSATVLRVDGAAELYPHLRVADLIVDNVSSGATAAANSLVEVAFVMDTSLRLYARTDRLDAPATRTCVAALAP